MANYNSQYTGAEVDAAVGKANAIPSATDINDTVSRALKTPLQVLQNNELVGVGADGSQIRVQLGEGLTLEGSTNLYTLKSSGGSKTYAHNIQCYFKNNASSTQHIGFVRLTLYNSISTPYDWVSFQTYLKQIGVTLQVSGCFRRSSPDVTEIISGIFAVSSDTSEFIRVRHERYIDSNMNEDNSAFIVQSNTFNDNVKEL